MTPSRSQDWELLVLHRLRWEINAVTSHDFLDPLLHRLSLERYLSSARVPDVRRQAQTFIVMCSTGQYRDREGLALHTGKRRKS